jgi:hypothetical protein
MHQILTLTLIYSSTALITQHSRNHHTEFINPEIRYTSWPTMVQTAYIQFSTNPCPSPTHPLYTVQQCTTGFIRGILRGVRYAKSLRVLFLHRRSPSWATLVLYSRAVFIFNEPTIHVDVYIHNNPSRNRHPTITQPSPNPHSTLNNPNWTLNQPSPNHHPVLIDPTPYPLLPSLNPYPTLFQPSPTPLLILTQPSPDSHLFTDDLLQPLRIAIYPLNKTYPNLH